MRWLAVVAFILVVGLAQGFPLYGSNGAVDCTIFGTFKEPFTPGNINAYQDLILYFDLSLERSDVNNNSVVDAVYFLTDGNHQVYRMRPEYTKDLQPKRSLIGFQVPKEAIAKSLTIDPSGDPSAGDQFTMEMGDLINASNGNATLFYYGILASSMTSSRRSLELDIGLTNNDSSRLYVSSRNWSLLDQWGWKYDCQKYGSNNQKWVPASVLEPNQTVRSTLFFPYISPLSRPTKLVYQYSNSSSLSIDIDTEAGLLANLTSQQGDNCCCPEEQAKTDPSTLAGSIKASKARLAKVRENLNTTS